MPKTRTRLGFLSAAFALIALSGCASPKQKETRFLQSGKERMLKQDYLRAAIEFQNAAQMMPLDPEPFYQLGLAFEATGRLTEAVSSLRHATDLDPHHAGAQVKLAELMALSGDNQIVRDGEKRVQKVLRVSPGNVDALEALALTEFKLGKWDDAEKHLDEALANLPQNVKASVVLARISVARHDIKGAEQVLKKAIQQTPQSSEAITALGQLYLLANRPADAETQFQNALKLDPRHVLALFGLASAQIRQGHPDQAEGTYQTLSAQPDMQYWHVYGTYLMKEGKRGDAIKEFDRLFKKNPADRDARTRLVQAYQSTGRISDAERILSDALAKDPGDIDALLQRSQILLRTGNSQQAEADLVQVLHFQPNSALARYLLSKVFESRGDALRQAQELSETLRIAPDSLAARLDLAGNMAARKLGQPALDLLDAAPAKQKNILGFIIQRNWILLDLGHRVQARKGIDLGLTAGRVPDLLLQDSALKLAQQDYTGARASAAEALKAEPENPRSMKALAAIYIAQQQPAGALQTLREHAARHPKSAPVQQFLGEWLIASGNTAQAREAFLAAKAADPNFTAADVALARLDAFEGKLDLSRKTLIPIVASSADANVGPRALLGTVEMQLGNHAAAIEHFRKVVEADPLNVLALNDLAYLLANFANRPDEALRFAQRAVELSPYSPDTHGTLGWVLYRKGLYQEARTQLQAAIARDAQSSSPNAAIRKYHLAMTLLKLKDRENGRKVLNAALRMNPNVPEAQTANSLFQ
jgi:tetratricopeptide (TPR) repeat protein